MAVKGILSLAANDDDACFLRNTESTCIECVNKEFSVNVYEFCMSDKGEVYFTYSKNKIPNWRVIRIIEYTSNRTIGDMSNN